MNVADVLVTVFLSAVAVLAFPKAKCRNCDFCERCKGK